MIEDISAIMYTRTSEGALIPRIYISNLETCNPRSFLKYNIQNVICLVNPEIEHLHLYPRDTIHQLQIAIYDHPRSDLYSVFKRTNKFIKDALQRGENILIHCHAGVSRSATITTAYIMSSQNLSYNEAYKIVKSMRRKVNVNPGFEQQLIKFENYKNLL